MKPQEVVSKPNSVNTRFLKKKQHYWRSKMRDLLTTLWVVFWLFSSISFAQEIATDTLENTQKITFSTIPNSKQKSLAPYYAELKKATYGVQRFSIFEQLAKEHIKKGTTDSILKYGNLFEKELGDWDKTESDKNHQYAIAHYLMGVGNAFNGLLEKATEWHIKGIQAAENANFGAYEYKNKVALAQTYLLKEQADKAINTIENALPSFSKKFSVTTNKALIVLGTAYLQQKKYVKAKTYFDEALQMATDFKDREMELTVLLEQAKLAEATKDYGEAFQGYEKTRNLALNEGYTALYFEGSLLLAKRYFKEEMYETANIALTFAYINAIDRENLQFQKEALELQARAFAKQADYKNAYAVFTQLQQVINKLSAKQQKSLIKELEIQYETLEKEKEITTLEEGQLEREAALQRQKTIKNAFLIGFLIILIPIMALLYVYYQKLQTQSELALKKEEINQQKVAALVQQQELNLIKAAVEGQDEERKRIAQELHDSIGGNLAGIKLQFASLTGDSKKLTHLTRQIDETYQLVRDISHTLTPKKFRQNGLTALIQDYVTTIANSAEFKVEFHPHPIKEINAIGEKYQVEIYKIIQELMTNTVKHAQASTVEIHLSLIDQNLALLFEDNGIGFNTDAITDGIGYENIKNRVHELEGNLHIDAVLKRGTAVSVEIPIKN